MHVHANNYGSAILNATYQRKGGDETSTGGCDW